VSRAAQADRAQRSRAEKVPWSCSDVFRLWASVGLGVLISLGFDSVVDLLQAIGLRRAPTGVQQALEADFGDQMVGWNAFALAYLILGFRGFSRCNRAELVRRIKASPPPRHWLKRYLLAGGGGPVWAVIVAIGAFITIITAVLEKESSTRLILGLLAVTIATSWLVITFVFALHYARRDIAAGGLEFSGDAEPVFSDYLYLAISCSATFGTTDTGITTTAMRRTVSLHGALAFVLNTVVVAVLLSVIVGD
jgi:uncharacterized membrane protein